MTLKLLCSLVCLNLVIDLGIGLKIPMVKRSHLITREYMRMSSAVENTSPKESTIPETTSLWERQWYPVHIAEDVEINTPTKVTVLEKDYVLWRHDKNNKFSAFVDLCPHRLAPLSEGRIETRRNTLQCAYHGWEFTEQGKCTAIPQLPNDKKFKNTPRSCLTKVPVQIRQGIVFMWPDVSPEGIEISMKMQPEVSEAMEGVESLLVVKDLPYGLDTLVENVVDPSHVSFAHHGIQGNREKPNGPELTAPVQEINKNHFLKVTKINKNNVNISINHHLKAPTFSTINFNIQTKMKTMNRNLVTFHCPTRPGESRLIAQFNKRLFSVKNLRWLDHMERNAVLDGDVVFLHKQERAMRELESKTDTSEEVVNPSNPSARLFFAPAPADGMVLQWRRWIRANGQPNWSISGADAKLPAEELNREKLLDRLNQHTKICSACRGAYKRLKRIAGALELMANVFPCLALVLLATNHNPIQLLGMTTRSMNTRTLSMIGSLGIISKILAMYLSRMIHRRFEFTDYVHARK